MSAVTLETLRADYDDANESIFGPSGPQTWPPQEWLEYKPSETLPPHGIARVKRLTWFATIYLIARDHGLNAAMLYKLSDGAIDPRVSA